MAKTSWAMSLAVILSALAQHGCKICSCAQGSGVQRPVAALAATSTAEAAKSGGSAAYNWKNVVILGGGFVSGALVFGVARRSSLRPGKQPCRSAPRQERPI